MRRIAVLDAPSNLGLRPPTPSTVPGCAKAPGALRDKGLLTRLGARDAGCLTAPRFDPAGWRPGHGVAHAGAIAYYTMRLADRIGAILDGGEFPLVLGGDCSITLGAALALRRHEVRDSAAYGLIYVDGHSDFRHPGNAAYVGAAAGEDLALATGRGQADLTNLDGLRPYLADQHVVLLGIRPDDHYRLDLQAAGIAFRTVPQLRAEGAARSAQWAREQVAECTGYWVHVDVDVLDPAVMPAVDAPDDGGIAYAELQLLIAGLVDPAQCLGLELTVFDPDYDPDGSYARELVDILVGGLACLTTTQPAGSQAALPQPAAPEPARRSAGPGHSGRTPAQRRAPEPEADAARPGPVRAAPDRLGRGPLSPGGLASGAAAPGGLARRGHAPVAAEDAERA